MEKVNYSQEDLKDHHAISAVIKNPKGEILMQDHVKYGFWTIPIGKAKEGQTPVEALKEEVMEECNLIVREFKEVVYKEMEYERDGGIVKVPTHVYEILSYFGELKNNEPNKHKEQRFMSIEEIKTRPYLSDSTVMFLKAIGINRNARI